MSFMITIPLRQHVGGPCKPIVEIGQEVKKGELIASPEGLGANIHSSVYGVVTAIENGNVVIEANDDQPDEFVLIKETETHLEAIKEAGVVGAGGAGFPAHVKFNIDLKGGYLLTNAAECEPVLEHNTLFMEEHPDVLIRGMHYVMKMINASKGYIAIKPKHKETMIILGKYLRQNNITDIEIKFLPDMYPAGDERVIVRELLGVELKPGQLPSEANAVVSNVETLKNVTYAIEDRKPVITKDITVGGQVADATTGEVFFDVPIGMPIKHYIDACGGYNVCHGEIVMGGPFTGKHADEESPVTKTTGGVLVAMPFIHDTRKAGIIACECGAQEDRLREIAAGMGATVVAEEKCKRMTEVGGRYRCDLPGICPGQAEKVLKLKKEGAEIIITGTCED